jgi:starch synthase (maltosyl-transferring)
MEIALDFAVQCAPDHPWLKQHPEWFEFRPDGTVKYAENPPKKYQDIVNVNFNSDAADALWCALRDVILFWIEQGVRIFRVDNPHTKPVPFWEWLIRDVQERHPDTIFLSEAFTRPPMLHMLAKLGFSQSYSYFTWRNTKDELASYAHELAQGPGAEYLRPNFFTNTPDILPPFLQRGGRPAFQIRLVLAATMASVYGIYNGFELCEATAIPGTEEYAASEKYQYKVWDWDRPGNIKDYIAQVNSIRRDNPALHHLRNLRVYRASDPNVIFYGKMTADRTNMVFVAVNLDPHGAHSSEIGFPLPEMGIATDAPYQAEELLTGDRFHWRGPVQHVHLDPQRNPAVIFRVSR